MIRPFLLLSAMALTLAACGPSDGPPIREADRTAGAETHPQLLAEFGGEYRGDEAAYVKQLGERMARSAGLEGQCTFTLVNSDVVNAFAVPGCYIYVTRGLMGIVNSEAELAAVLGHELGHIIGRHAQRQQQRMRWRSLGVIAVGLFTGSERLAEIAGAAAGLFSLRYSRTQEYEADDLGLAYLRAADLDPFAAADMLDALGRHERHQARTRGVDEARSIPEWARTHPLSENRTRRAREAAAATGLEDDELPENAPAYLAVVDGLLFGDDPEQGFVLGRRFAHPMMRIAFEAPPGFSLTNSPEAILIEGPDGMRGQFAAGRFGRGGLAGYSEAVLGRLAEGARVEVVGSAPDRINGLRALITEAVVSARGEQVAIIMAAYGAGDTAYHFVMLADPARPVPGSLRDLFDSFRLLGPEEASRLRGREIDVVAVSPGQSAQALAERMASANPLDDFLAINGLNAGDGLQPGQPVKIVDWR